MIKRYNQRRRTSKKPLLLGFLVLVALAGIVAVLELTGVTHFVRKNAAPQTANQNTKGEGPNQTASENGATGTEKSSDQAQTGGGTYSSDNKTPNANQTTKLDVPTGNFVSNHRRNLSGSPAPNKLQSSCVTTPGATCQIIFTKDGATKSLEAKKTDAGGGVYWEWKLQDAGLTKGSWKVQAKATLGTQIETAEDSLLLEVQQ